MALRCIMATYLFITCSSAFQIGRHALNLQNVATCSKGRNRLGFHSSRGENPHAHPHPHTDDIINSTNTCTDIGSQINIDNRLDCGLSSRRRALQLLSVSAAALAVIPMVSNAGVAEIDSKSGELFSPKNDMLGGGGSDMARGIKLQSKNRQAGKFGEKGAPIQVVYETRFITYLSRFLLNFDPAAETWWKEQVFSDSNAIPADSQVKLRFAEFAESVEVGLADYFVGPYGSYASVQAAKAGLLAKSPATSSTARDVVGVKTGFFESVKKQFKGKGLDYIPLKDSKARAAARQGILNLFVLLQARYTSPEEKRQLAILFSLIANPKLQPTKEIEGILGEADNGSISEIKAVGLLEGNASFRGSSRHGGGYTQYDKPKVLIESPPALGASYKPAEFKVTTKPTSRILSIKLLSGGKGYTSVPRVDIISQGGVKTPCDATAILDRNGSVECIVVLDPGLGYGSYNKQNDIAPEIRIAPPKIPRGTNMKDKEKYAPAIAVAELEYEINTVKIVDGGNGYILDHPPQVVIEPPQEDADWYVSPIDQRTWKAVDSSYVELKVLAMKSKTSGKIVSNSEQSENTNAKEADLNRFDNLSIFDNLSRDPLALIPSTAELQFTAPGGNIPGLETTAVRNGNYRLRSLPVVPATLFLPSTRYRAYDPIFGAIGSKPVTKNARKLTASEYTRLAISGGICTVVVRTALNPLELVKTKIQLNNDVELFQTIAQSSKKEVKSENSTLEDLDDEDGVGTLDVFKSMISTRGLSSLFQSADVTFLASVVFGSLGFGATELFRRSFTMVFFPDGGKGTGEEFIVLTAAALACTITSLVAAPFEILRVRSMGYVEAQPVLTVLSDFLAEKREQRFEKGKRVHSDLTELSFFNITKEDIPPLFSGFVPIVSRELPFAVIKFLAFDLVASAFITILNSQSSIIEPVQVGAGTLGLAVSASAGAIAGIAGALVSHPADLILTLTSSKKSSPSDGDEDTQGSANWKPIVQDLLSKDGGILNLFAGLPARSTFFFLVIGLQFFLYDYAKNIFDVGSEDLTLVLDVFYAIRQGLV